MAENSFSYQVQPKTQEGEAPLTSEQRDQLRSPGKAILDGNGFRIEQPQSSPVATPVERAAAWRDNLEDANGQRIDFTEIGNRPDANVFVYCPDGDRIPLAVAKRSGIVRVDPATGRLVMVGETSRPTEPQASGDQKPSEESKPKQENTPSAAEDRVPELQGDASLGRIAEAVGDATIYQLIGQAALGEPLANAKAESIAQVLGVDPENVQNVHSALIAEYSEVGTKALMAAGVAEEKTAEAMTWLSQHKKGDLLDAVNDMVRQSKRSTSALKALGREFVRATGGGFTDSELEQMALPDGAHWHRGEHGELLITIKNWGTTSAQGALRQGILRP